MIVQGGPLIVFLSIVIGVLHIESFPLHSSLPSISTRWLETTQPIVTFQAPNGTDKCTGTKEYRGASWWLGLFLALVLIALTGLLAGLTLAVMSVDLAKLKMLTRTGTVKRRCNVSRSTLLQRKAELNVEI